MMLAGQAVLGRVGQHTAQHAAQRIARQDVISNVIGRHYRSCRVRIRAARMPVTRLAYAACYPASAPRSAGVAVIGGYTSRLKWRLLLPGASEPRLAELN